MAGRKHYGLRQPASYRRAAGASSAARSLQQTEGPAEVACSEEGQHGWVKLPSEVAFSTYCES
jgi:hypothetical protein